MTAPGGAPRDALRLALAVWGTRLAMHARNHPVVEELPQIGSNPIVPGVCSGIGPQ